MRLVSRRLVILCLAGGTFLAGSAWGYAQRAIMPPGLQPLVLSGADIGFKVQRQKGDAAVGELVVRINGEWKRAQFAYGVNPVVK